MNFSQFEIDDLMQPISSESLTGEDPRNDVTPTSSYYLLKEVRNSARAKERKALTDDESVQAIACEWRPIVEQVPQALKKDCKDLEFVAWFIEALCRLHGFRGLAFGFNLAHLLIENYWDNLYPTPDPEDLSERIAPIIGLNGVESEGSLIQPIKSILITDGQSEGSFSTWQYEQALEVDRLDQEKQEKRFAAGAVSWEDVELSIKESSDIFFVELNDDITKAIEAFSLLSSSMDKAMGGEPQPTSYINQSLKSCANCVQQIAKDILIQSNLSKEVSDLTIDEEPLLTDTQPQSDAIGISKKVTSRSQAIEHLDIIAEYFKKTEPHSPMSYAIEQVIRWSDLSLPELLQELIVDGDARNGFFKLSGIKTED